MDNTTVVLIIRGLMSLLLGAGGIVAIVFGFKLYTTGTGIEKDGTTIKWDKIKVQLKTVGAVLMFTACVWAFFAVQSLPDYKSESDSTIVTVASASDSIKFPIDSKIAADDEAGLEQALTIFSNAEEHKGSFIGMDLTCGNLALAPRDFQVKHQFTDGNRIVFNVEALSANRDFLISSRVDMNLHDKTMTISPDDVRVSRVEEQKIPMKSYIMFGISFAIGICLFIYISFTGRKIKKIAEGK